MPPPTTLRQGFVVLAIVVLATTGIGSARIVLTHRIFSQTYDEPASVAAGMEWLDRGTYRVEYSAPPLGRLAVAVGPYLNGLRLPGFSSSPYRD